MYVQGTKTDSTPISGVNFTASDVDGMFIKKTSAKPAGVLITNRQEFEDLAADVVFAADEDLIKELGML
jgi:hypothetical protein